MVGAHHLLLSEKKSRKGWQVTRLREASKQGWKEQDRREAVAGEEEAHLEGHIGHGLGQVVRFEAVPVVEMLPHEDGHL